MSQNIIWLLCGGFFIFVFFLGGVAAIIFGFQNRKKATESVDWPKTAGTIIRTEIREDMDTDAEGFTTSSFVPEVEYQYHIGDEVYTSQRVSFGGTRTYNTRKKAEESLSQYSINGPTNVFYNPQKPDEAVLVQGTKGTLILIIVGVVFVAISICGTCVGGYLLLFNQ